MVYFMSNTISKLIVISTLVILPFVIVGCGSGSSSKSSREEKPIMPKPSTSIVRKSNDYQWHDCTLPPPAPSGSQCTLVEVPLNWDAPDGRQIQIAVVRYLANGTPSGDIWALDGGPSLWGSTYATHWAQRFIQDRDLYIPMLRGTGASTFLNCSVKVNVNQTLTQQCFDELYQEYGDDLVHFNIISSSDDLGYLIKNMSEQSTDTVVYGTSFGGYRAQRYLQKYPNQADAIVIDSAAYIGNQTQYQSIKGNDVGYLLLDYCAQDEFCTDKLGGNPHQYFEQTYQQLAAGQCAVVGNNEGQISLDHIKETLYWLLGYRRYSLIPAFTKLLNRCETNDQILLTALAEMEEEDIEEHSEYTGGTVTMLNGYDWSNIYDNNLLLAINLEMAEVFTPTETVGEFLTHNDNLRFSTVSDELYQYQQIWQLPKLNVDNTPADTDIPILIMHTDMDEGTVLAEAHQIANDYSGENQHLVVIPRMSHAVGLFAWHSCPEKILKDFLKDHQTKPDTNCLSDIPDIDFTLESDWGKEISRDIFGVDNLWKF